MPRFSDRGQDIIARSAASRRMRFAAAALAVLLSVALVLLWAGHAHTGVQFFGHPYADYAADPDAIRRRLLVAVLVMLIFCVFVGWIAWMIDRADAIASGRAGGRKPSQRRD